jgi:hypothetical protein
MRGWVINKILSLQYLLGRTVGRKMARRICIIMERGFTVAFGREIYQGHD